MKDDSFVACHTSEHEVGLEREFKLENGLLKGFKRVSSMLFLLFYFKLSLRLHCDLFH